MSRRADVEIGMLDSILDGVERDFQELERWWPSQKRGSNARRVVMSILARIAAAKQCVKDAIDSNGDAK